MSTSGDAGILSRRGGHDNWSHHQNLKVVGLRPHALPRLAKTVKMVGLSNRMSGRFRPGQQTLETMTMKCFLLPLLLVVSLLVLPACEDAAGPETASDVAGDSGSGSPKSSGSGLLKVGVKKQASGNYIVLGTLTDQFDRAQAKANVEDTLARHSDISAMVGLFAYNPPAILEALAQADRLGEGQTIRVIAFDEDDATLQGIKDGTVFGTVVQNPYMYGYKSIEVLSALESGKSGVIPENKFIDIPARQIRKADVDAFWSDLKLKVGGDAKNETKPGKPRFAYVTNGVASFWTIASKGVIAAGNDLGVNTDVLMPAEGIADQKRMIEDLITRGVQGIAVSPIDAENQVDLLNQAAKKTRLITHDSDAPAANRLVYIGMDNYLAGRMCGELIREALPDGGKVMLFIGRLEQDNARLRRQGVIDALLGRSVDSSRFDPSDSVLEGR
jgi:ribose transport system substrate-binding protein